jgi:hypothetical protein
VPRLISTTPPQLLQELPHDELEDPLLPDEVSLPYRLSIIGTKEGERAAVPNKKYRHSA